MRSRLHAALTSNQTAFLLEARSQLRLALGHAIFETNCGVPKLMMSTSSDMSRIDAIRVRLFCVCWGRQLDSHLALLSRPRTTRESFQSWNRMESASRDVIYAARIVSDSRYWKLRLWVGFLKRRMPALLEASPHCAPPLIA